MELTFIGAAREVTGSCHLLHVADRTLALDCGMFHGRRQEAASKNAALPIALEQLHAVVLSHAHIDHSGRLPFLARKGFSGPIWATDPKNTVLIVGFQAEHTLGRRIVERRPLLRIFGQDVPLRARVEVIDGYSAHADQREVVAWLDAVRERSPGLKKVWLAHGEPPAQDALETVLRARGYTVEAPAPHSRVSLR